MIGGVGITLLQWMQPEIRIEIPEVVLTAIVVAAGAVLTTVMNARQIRKGKTQDWARQDALSDQAAKSAKELLQVSELIVQRTQVANGKLSQVHELVNSNALKQMEDTHSALAQQAVLMHEVISLHTMAGREPSPAALEAIRVIERKVTELSEQIAERIKATEIADAKLGQERPYDGQST